MGSLSNLYISQSYQSLIHLGSDTSASTTPTQLQDGIGTNIGIYVNTNGEVSASSFSGSINGIGNVSAFSTSVDSRLDSLEFKDGTFVTTASFNSFSSSVVSEITAIESFTASVSTSVGLLQTFSSSQYKGDSASFDSRILAITSSGGVPSGTVSSSAQISALGFATTASLNAYTQSTNTFTASISTSVGLLQTFSASADSRYVQNSQTSSMAVSSSLYSVTSSYAVFAQTASEARNVVVVARNGNQSTLSAGTVVRITGASGDNPIFNTASYDTETLSSNTLGVLRTSIASGADGEVTVNGVVLGVNTDPALGYVAGDIIYLGANGTFTRTQPQAPLQTVTLGEVLRAQQNNGSIYVNVSNGWELNELHNVQINTPLTNDLLAYESSSYGLWKNKSISQLGLATTGSNSFTGSQIVSGSLTVLGNLTAYTASFITVTSSVVVGGNTILLNTFLPSVRFGGMEVIDSGSTGLTGSMLWDSLNDVWVYVNPSGSSYVSARLISGPKSLTLGSEPTLTQNRVPKADDGDHLVDSQISDDGTTVSVTNAFSASTIVGIGNVTEFSQSVDSRLDSIENKTGSFATTGSNVFVGDQYLSNGVLQVSTYPETTKQWFSPTAIEAIGTASVAYEQFVAAGGYDAFNVITTLDSGSQFRDLPSDTFVLNTWLEIPRNTGNNPAPQFKRGLGVTGSTSINGTLQISSSATYDLDITGGFQATAASRVSGSSGITNIQQTLVSVTTGSGALLQSFTGGRGYMQVIGDGNAISIYAKPSTIGGFSDGAAGGGFAVRNLSNANYYPIQFQSTASFTDGRVTFTTPISASAGIVGDTSISGSLTLSSSNAVELTVIGGVVITGSVAGNIVPLTVTSNTASIDFNLGTFFTLAIPTGSVTYITGSNLVPGSTANLRLTQGATTGSVRFESSLFKFPSGSINTGSAVTGAVDLYSFAMYDTTNILSVGANRLI